VKAAVQVGFGGLDQLQVKEVPDPRPAAGEVLVRVRATTLNRLDVIQREGPALLPHFQLPHIAGMDVVGEVAELGDGVRSVSEGDRVLLNPALHCGTCEWCERGEDPFCPATRVIGGNHPGGYAELCTVPASHVHPIPDHVSFEEAATVPTIWSTAWQALVVRGQVRPGEWVLIHAAASGVSTAAIQLAKRVGAKVLATAGSERKLDLARKLGADLGVNNRSDDFVKHAREATGGRGVDVVFDHVGPALFGRSLFALKPRGRLVFCGSTTGREAAIDLPYAYHFGISLLGVEPYSYTGFAEMLDFYWGERFVAVIDTEFGLDEAAQAQARMESGEAMGKILLRL